MLIIQNDIGNMFSPTVIAAAMTSRVEPIDRLPTHVNIGNRFGCTVESVVMLEQIFTLDKQRLKSYFGCVQDEETLRRIDNAIAISLDLR